MFPSPLILADFANSTIRELRGSPLVTDCVEINNLPQPFSNKKKLIMLGIEPTHTMLRSGRSTHQATARW